MLNILTRFVWHIVLDYATVLQLGTGKFNNQQITNLGVGANGLHYNDGWGVSWRPNSAASKLFVWQLVRTNSTENIK